LEGSGSDLIDVLFRHLPEVTEEKQKRSQNKRPPRRNLKTTRPSNKLCEFNIPSRVAHIYTNNYLANTKLIFKIHTQIHRVIKKSLCT